MITSEAFDADLTDFVHAYSRTDSEAVFKLYESNGRMYAEQRQIIEKNGMRVHRLISIVYSEAYSVPVLWFNFYDTTGQLLYVENFESFLSTDSSSVEILKGLSQNEHPMHGIAFFNIHPCRTADFMKSFITRNYITSWLSVYGAIVGLDVSDVVEKTLN